MLMHSLMRTAWQGNPLLSCASVWSPIAKLSLAPVGAGQVTFNRYCPWWCGDSLCNRGVSRTLRQFALVTCSRAT